MKRVIRNYDEAIKFVHSILDEYGEHFERPLMIDCKVWQPPRSIQQNAKLHAMLGELANHIGYSLDELKDYMKTEYGPRKRFQFNDHVRMIPKSTAEYSKIEMMDFIGQVERIGADLGFAFSDQLDEG